uniref:Pdgfa associated protein 1a n=1 Tax=Lepisosteus oculatus TaxID=7918 RepID=W5LWR6_LEPOC
MPRGGKKGHKGRGKQFSNPEEIDRQMRLEREKVSLWSPPVHSRSPRPSDTSHCPRNPPAQRHLPLSPLTPEPPGPATPPTVPADSRTPREEIEKQKAKERYMKLHLEGKTEQARADLARLAIIKKQREEAARKREELRKVKEEAEAKSKR